MTNEILFNLAVCNMVDKVKVFEDKLILSKQIDNLINPIVKERKEQDENDNDIRDKELPRTVTQEIRERRDNINKIKKDKEKKILTMLGQIYNGVIIPEQLTVRRGEFYRYRCQYALDLDSVKTELLKNLHAVTEKVTVSKNLDILEYVLNAWDKEKDKVSTPNRRSRYSNYDDEDDKAVKKDFRFDEVIIVENSSNRSDNPNTSFDVLHTNGVSVYDNGTVDFFYQMGNDRNRQSFQSENFNALYNKFKDEISKLAENFIKELDDEIKKRTDNLDEIKLKGSHLLMSAELQKGSEDLKGYGN